MGWFKKNEQKPTIDDLIGSYGGNARVEELEAKLLTDLSQIFNNRTSIEALKYSQAKNKIDWFSDQLVLTLLSDEAVLNIIRANNDNNVNIWRQIADAFNPQKNK